MFLSGLLEIRGGSPLTLDRKRLPAMSHGGPVCSMTQEPRFSSEQRSRTRSGARLNNSFCIPLVQITSAERLHLSMQCCRLKIVKLRIGRLEGFDACQPGQLSQGKTGVLAGE